MPAKLRRIFQKEYGKEKGTRIFYACQNKRRIMGVNLEQKVSPQTYPVKIKHKKIMGIELKKSVPIKPVNFKKLYLLKKK
jgi:hypothetical protein